jgi:hypothetical protein
MAKRKEKPIKFWDVEDDFGGEYDDGFMSEMPGCCGIIELIGLERGKTPYLVAAVAQKAGLGRGNNNEIFPSRHNLYVFTDASSRGYGRALAAYIRKHRLGVLAASPICLNPRHNSRVQGWFWRINRARLKAWANKNVEWNAPEDKDERTETTSLPVW